jgi:hypothetical protein
MGEDVFEHTQPLNTLRIPRDHSIARRRKLRTEDEHIVGPLAEDVAAVAIPGSHFELVVAQQAIRKIHCT